MNTILDSNETLQNDPSTLRPYSIIRIETFIIIISFVLAIISFIFLFFFFNPENAVFTLAVLSFLYPLVYIHQWKSRLDILVTQPAIKIDSKVSLGIWMIIGLLLTIFWLVCGVIFMFMNISIIMKIVCGYFIIIYLFQGYFYIKTFFDLITFKRI